VTATRWRVAVVVALVVLLAGATLGSRGWLWDGTDRPAAAPAAQPARQGVGAGVAVVGAPAPVALHAAVAPARVHAPLPAGLATGVSPTFIVGPSGQLARPLTLEFPLQRRMAADGRTLVFTSQSPAGPWTPLPTTVTADGLHARVLVAHLSLFGSVHLDVDGALQVLKQFFDGLTSHLAEDAEPPRCPRHDQAVADGYAAAAAGADSVRWCLDLRYRQPVLRAVNNRRSPLLVLPRSVTLLGGGSGGTVAQQLARLLSPNGTVIYPRDEAAFGANLAPGKRAGFEVTVGQQAQLLSSLDVGVKAVFAIITRFGASKDPNRELKVLHTLLSADACLHSTSAGEMIANCLSAKQIIEAFGAVWGVILAPLVTVSGVVDYFHGALNGFLDQFSGRTYATVAMRRSGAPPFAQFVGRWWVHGATLEIKADHSADQTWNVGPCTASFPPGGTADGMCRGNAALKVEGSPTGVTLTYLRVWYTTWSGKPAPAGFDPGQGVKPGARFELTRDPRHPGLLTGRPLTPVGAYGDPVYGNPYWCGAGIRQADQRLCGA
jgi:hypothetical protein